MSPHPRCWLPGLLLLGCADVCPPPEAAGGTEAEQAAAEAEAEAFLGVMRRDICVPKIKLGNLRKEAVGKYSPTTRRIKVQKDRDLEAVRSTVRHEMCHALQFQHDLDLTGPTYHLALPIDVPDDERAGEAWAYTCQQGPEPAFLMGESCSDDLFRTDIFADVRDQFLVPDEVLERTVRFDEVGRLMVGDDAVWMPTVAGSLLVEEEGSEQVVDLRSGLPVPPAPALQSSADLGDRRLLYYAAFAANGSQGLRLVYEDEQGPTRAGCLRNQETPFAVDDALWSVYLDGDELVWGTWSTD